MSEGIYYLKLSGRVEGPFSIGQIYDLWAARKINSQTPFARFEEMDKWQPISELTLKISAPKGAPARESAPESAPSLPSRGKSSTPSKSEEYFPTLPYPVEPVRERPGRRGPSLPELFKRNLNYSFFSGFCVVLGLIVILSFMFLLSAEASGKQVDQNMLFLKQNGVIVGTGLVLMGGLLQIARLISELVAAQKPDAARTETAKKNDRKA